MRPEKLYLTDIVDAAKAIEKFCKGIEFKQFEGDDMRRSAVLQKLIVIGEAVARLSAEFVDAHSDIPWVDIIGFRNFAVHEYFAVKWDVVWLTANEEVPYLRKQVSKLLRNEFRE